MSGPTSPDGTGSGPASVVERLSPPPPRELVAARIERHTAPGDLVLDLHGRGGWVARSAIDRGRRAISLEQGPLAGLLAELVLRPPDPHHLDAAFEGLVASTVGDAGLRRAVEVPFATTCPTCGTGTTADAFTWAVGPPPGDGRPQGVATLVARHVRCAACGDAGDAEHRHGPPTDDDRERAAAAPARDEALRDAIRRRFPVPAGSEALVEDVLALHTPRQLAGLATILAAIEGELRAEPIEAALRLALLESLLPASRLAAPGSHAAPHLRIADGRVRAPNAAVWLERSPWTCFAEGFATVRLLVERLSVGAGPPARAAITHDLRDAQPSETTASHVVLVDTAAPSKVRAFATQAAEAARHDRLPRVALAIGQAPRRPDPVQLATAWHGTAWALGREAAAALPVEPLLAPAFQAPWDWPAASVRRTLAAVEPLLDPDARAVLLVDGTDSEAVAAAALGAAGAGFRLAAADPGTPGRDRALELVPPGASPPPGPRTRANVSLPPVQGSAGDPALVPGRGLFSPPERVDARPFSVIDAAQRVSDAAVAALCRRGEPAPFGTLLGEVLVALDRAGQLRRLAASRPPDPDDPDAGLDADDADHDRDADVEPSAAPVGPRAADSGDSDAVPVMAGRTRSVAADAPTDQVGRLLAVIRDELTRPTQRRLVEVEHDRWWLRDADDRASAAQPLADRLEWATYGLLSTGVPMPERRFRERIDALFAGADRPEPALVAATLESYRSPAIEEGLLATDEDLVRRSHEHTELLAALAGAGRRLGMRIWIAAREQDRRVGGQMLGQRLTDQERDAYLPRVTRGPVDVLEAVDVIWYVRDRATFLIEVEWTAMVGDLLRRHAAIPHHDRLVRLLLIPPERSALLRHKLDRSAPLRQAFQSGNWHVLKWSHLATFLAREPLDLGALEPLLGFEPAIEQTGEQLPLFGAGR